jgi:hypothetical protein
VQQVVLHLVVVVVAAAVLPRLVPHPKLASQAVTQQPKLDQKVDQKVDRKVDQKVDRLPRPKVDQKQEAHQQKVVTVVQLKQVVAVRAVLLAMRKRVRLEPKVALLVRVAPLAKVASHRQHVVLSSRQLDLTQATHQSIEHHRVKSVDLSQHWMGSEVWQVCQVWQWATAEAIKKEENLSTPTTAVILIVAVLFTYHHLCDIVGNIIVPQDLM